MSAPDRAALRAHLVDSRIAGEVATSREDNLLKYGMLAARLPKAMFGLGPTGRWNLGDILALMAERVGVSPDATHLRGQDRIDPDLTIDALDRMAGHLAVAARERSRVLLATGHPADDGRVAQLGSRSGSRHGVAQRVGGAAFRRPAHFVGRRRSLRPSTCSTS